MGSAEREMLNHMGTKILEKNDGRVHRGKK